MERLNAERDRVCGLLAREFALRAISSADHRRRRVIERYRAERTAVACRLRGPD
jgi:hypothetical protein